MTFELRDYQQDAINHARNQVLLGHRGIRTLYSSPTGTGKSFIILGIRDMSRELLGEPVIISPRIEILEGIAEKDGHVLHASRSKRERQLEDLNMYTPVRLRNRLMSGAETAFPCVIIDEAHHSTADTYELLQAIHGDAPTFGVTATAFRGSPKESNLLKQSWKDIVILLGWRDAVNRSVVSMPHCEIVPLFNDDEISIRGADFQVGGKGGLNTHIGSRLDALIDQCKAVWETDHRPTMLSLPSSQLVSDAVEKLLAKGVPAQPVTQKTKPVDRQAAFKACVERRAMLVQINVVSEGVDLPIRIQIDAKPTLSPVAWQQQVGRITRPVGPGEQPARYICTNRNLERHGYLMEGLIPRAVVKAAQEGFEGPTKRAGHRQIGLEALGRYKPIRVPLYDGLEASAFNLVNWDNETGRRVEYFVILLPGADKTLVGRRINQKAGEEWSYGKYERVDLPAEFVGFQTSSWRGQISDKQRNWWKRDARRYGLDPDFEVRDGRTFQVLPLLANLRTRIM